MAIDLPVTLTIYHKGVAEERALDQEIMFIGRRNTNDIVLPNYASGEHAKLVWSGDYWRVTDLDSTNGTTINGSRLEPQQEYMWQADDDLVIGPYTLRWQAPAQLGLVARPEFDQSTFLDQIKLTRTVIQIQPGLQESVELQVENTLDETKHFYFDIDGVPTDWVTLNPPRLQINSGKTGFVTITFNLIDHTPASGIYPFRVALHTADSSLPVDGFAMGLVIVPPQHNLSVALNPQELNDNGTFEVRIQNKGNVEEHLVVTPSPSQSKNAVVFDTASTAVTVQPGKTKFVEMPVTSLDRPIRGSEKPHPIEFGMLDSDSRRTETLKGSVKITPLIPQVVMRVITFIPILLTVGIAGLGTFMGARGNTIVRNVAATVTASAALAAEEEAIATATVQASNDQDGDGLLDIYEAECGTDETKVDTDDDGIPDFEEIDENCVQQYGTDPTNRDTDGDGLIDGDEIRGNPNPPAQCPNVRGVQTFPNKRDSDGDGLDDCVDASALLLPTVTPTPEVNLVQNGNFDQGTDDFVNVATGVRKDELNVPIGWTIFVDDEVENDQFPDEDTYVFPEMEEKEVIVNGVVKTGNIGECINDIPDPICDLIDKEKILKVHKNGRAIRFAMVQTQVLPAGVYRFEVNYVADIVADSGPPKQYVPADGGYADIFLCVENAVPVESDFGGWYTAEIGAVANYSQEFAITGNDTSEGGSRSVRLFAIFRSPRRNVENNWWFDNWKIQPVGELEDYEDRLTEDTRVSCRADLTRAQNN